MIFDRSPQSRRALECVALLAQGKVHDAGMLMPSTAEELPDSPIG